MEQQLKRKIILLGIILLLTLGYFLQMQDRNRSNEVINEVTINNGSENAENSILRPEIISKDIYVHIAGAVENPGVYTLQEGQRVEDAIQLAGIREDSDIDALNRAAIINDGQKIIVPVIGANDTNQTITNEKLNLNYATLTQLMALPGIGEVKANAILQYRTRHGSFQTVEELLQVHGIGTAIYEELADQVCV